MILQLILLVIAITLAIVFANFLIKHKCENRRLKTWRKGLKKGDRVAYYGLTYTITDINPKTKKVKVTEFYYPFREREYYISELKPCY